jgi:hypothetical protein
MLHSGHVPSGSLSLIVHLTQVSGKSETRRLSDRFG